MFDKKNIETNAILQAQQERILTKTTGKEISTEELQLISGGDGSGTNYQGQGTEYFDKSQNA